MTNKKIKVALILMLIIIAASVIFFLTKRTEAPALISKKSSDSKENNDVKTPVFDKTKYSTNDPNSIWIVANKTRILNPIYYAPDDLVAIGGDQKLRSEAATAFLKLQTDAKNVGLIISPLSGYRSYNTQVTVYNREVAKYGKATADSQSARPGSSEHQTGLAVDVGGGGCGIEDCFGDTAEGKWTAAEAYKYGFIVRYVDDKQLITGYRAEPWHIRYVGVDLATEMHNQGTTTLEEFFGLPAAPDYE